MIDSTDLMKAATRGHIAGSRSMLDTAALQLAAAGVDSPRLDAEILLAEAAGVSRQMLFANELTASYSIADRYAQSVARRARREPLAYIIGRKEFYSIELEVTPAVLIPRPETETVVACALEFLAARPCSRVLDIGTGSGAIALALALNAPRAEVVASDVSATALEVASRNVNRLMEGVNATAPDEPSRSFNGSRITIRRADCFTVLDAGPPLGRFDLIVSNPPYIRREEIDCLQPEVSAYEPRVALCGGADGMDFYRRIVAQAADHLVAGGAVIVEIADHQSDAVARLFSDAAVTSVSLVRDLGGTPRVIRAEWPTVRPAADRSWKK